MVMTIGALLVERLGDLHGDALFLQPHRARDYALFADVAARKGVRIVVGFFSNLNDGVLREGFEHDGTDWIKRQSIAIDMIFDRSISDDRTTPEKRTIQGKIPIVNDPDLNLICWDKACYPNVFPDLVPKTYLIQNKEELQKHLNAIETDRYVLKPRYGITGFRVQILDRDGSPPDDVWPDTILQEYVDTSLGNPDMSIIGVHEFRVVVLRNRVRHCYVKVAGSTRTANVSQGARSLIVPNDQIPPCVMDTVASVTEEFGAFEDSFYAVDCGVAAGNEAFLIEVESMPGLRAAYVRDLDFNVDFLSDLIDLLVEAHERRQC